VLQGSGGVLQTATSDVAVSPIAECANPPSAVSAGGGWEYAAVKRYVNASTGTVKIPPGVYYLEGALFYSGSPTGVSATCSLTPSTGMIYTDNVSCGVTTNTTGPEFVSAPSNPATIAGNANMKGLIRVAAVQGGLGSLMPTLTFTFTGTMYIVGATCNFFRVPDFGQQPFYMTFPQGNANGYVPNEGVMMKVTMRAGPGSDAAVLRELVCPAKYVAEVKKSMLARALEKDDERMTGVFFSVVQVKSAEKLVERKTAEEPSTPELVDIEENPLTRSLHVSSSAASAIRAMLGKRLAD